MYWFLSFSKWRVLTHSHWFYCVIYYSALLFYNQPCWCWGWWCMILHIMVIIMMQQSTNDRARGETTTRIQYSSFGWWLTAGEADWGGQFRSRDIATLVAIRRKCTGHILKLSDTRRCPLAVSERTSKSNLYDNNTRKCQDNGHLSMARSLSI
jgi:hypothetical protein